MMNPYDMYGDYSQMQQGYPQMQQGYPQDMYGGMNMIRYTRGQYLDGLRNYVTNSSGVAIMKEERIEDVPNLLRHACAEAKVSYLPKCQFYVPETGVTIPFYFCLACGKLFYFKDFM